MYMYEQISCFECFKIELYFVGVLTVLKFPYPRHVEEPGYYDHVKIHAEFGRTKTPNDSPHLAVSVPLIYKS
jgi:hypothetical protein